MFFLLILSSLSCFLLLFLSIYVLYGVEIKVDACRDCKAKSLCEIIRAEKSSGEEDTDFDESLLLTF